MVQTSKDGMSQDVFLKRNIKNFCGKARFELLKKETNVRYAIYKKYKIIYEIMDDKVYILRVIHHSQNITTNFFLAENEIPYVVPDFRG